MSAWSRGELLRTRLCWTMATTWPAIWGVPREKDVREWFDGDREAQDVWLQARFVTHEQAMDGETSLFVQDLGKD